MAADPRAATCFQVSPAVVEFREVQPGEPRSAQLTIKVRSSPATCQTALLNLLEVQTSIETGDCLCSDRPAVLQNIDSKVRGVRVRSFATSSFLLKGPQGNVKLAPGLTVSCEVRHKAVAQAISRRCHQGTPTAVEQACFELSPKGLLSQPPLALSAAQGPW